ncbi:hypothetical protein ACLOJK_006903 [Asimina triloba]
MTNSHSLGWFWTSTQSNQGKPMIDGSVAAFTMESLNDPKAMKLVENARRKLMSPHSCWQNAYMSLFAGCSEIISDKEKQSRLAWYLSDCFQKESGRPQFPACDSSTPMVKCLKNLDEFAHKIYLEFFLETNSICHQLQTDAFKHETERLVNDLKRSAQFAEDKLETIEEKSETLLQSSDRVQNSLRSIDQRTQQVVKASENVGDRVKDVLEHSKAIIEQSKGIKAAQDELQQGQLEMKVKMESGMELLHESYSSLNDGIEKLRVGAVEIEKEISEVGDLMALKMQTLQSKADDIGNVTGMSLDKQKELLDGQSVALQGLDFLTKFQSQALEESRASLQRLADFGHEQQEELLRRQDQLREAHEHLIQSSQTILAAQADFRSKQAAMFTALDHLFKLHNAILLESRFIKTFFFYACEYLHPNHSCFSGLCITFIVEFALARLAASNLDQQPTVQSRIFWARSSFLLAASIQILHSIFSYRDYDVLNHQMLLTLTEKLSAMEMNTGKKLLSLSMDSNTYLSSWIDSDLADSAGCKGEEVAENSITTTSRYNLRPRRRR